MEKRAYLKNLKKNLVLFHFDFLYPWKHKFMGLIFTYKLEIQNLN